ncbi:MAG: hypothetical protein AAGC92_03300 [Pseudomonadota bacterium]
MLKKIAMLVLAGGVGAAAIGTEPARADNGTAEALVGIIVGATALAIIADAVDDDRRVYRPRPHYRPRYRPVYRPYVHPYVHPRRYVHPHRYVAPRVVVRPRPAYRRPIYVDRRVVRPRHVRPAPRYVRPIRPRYRYAAQPRRERWARERFQGR